MVSLVLKNKPTSNSIWQKGTTKGVRFENGTMLNLDDMIQDRMKDDVHVWVLLKGRGAIEQRGLI